MPTLQVLRVPAGTHQQLIVGGPVPMLIVNTTPGVEPRYDTGSHALFPAENILPFGVVMMISDNGVIVGGVDQDFVIAYAF